MWWKVSVQSPTSAGGQPLTSSPLFSGLDPHRTHITLSCAALLLPQETTGNGPTAPWIGGLCFINEGAFTANGCQGRTDQSFCTGPMPGGPQWTCKPGAIYRGRGPVQVCACMYACWSLCLHVLHYLCLFHSAVNTCPSALPVTVVPHLPPMCMQLTYDYNYYLAGQALGVDLINNPDLLTTDPVLSWKSALWFWMTPQSPKPACHDVITGKVQSNNGRVAGSFGWVTDIINGGVLQCGNNQVTRSQGEVTKISYYTTYCQIFGVSTGPNVDCSTAMHY